MEPASVQKRLDRDELSPVAIYPASVIGTLSLLRALMDFRASSLPYRFAFSDFQALPVLALYPRPPAHRCTCSDHARRCALSGYGVEENTINVNIIAALALRSPPINRDLYFGSRFSIAPTPGDA